MGRRLWADVVKGDDKIVGVNLFRRNFARYDLAEKTILNHALEP